MKTRNHRRPSCSLLIKSSLPSIVSRELKTSLKSGFTISEVAVYIRAVPSSTPYSFIIVIVIAMVLTWLVGGADDASTLVEIFSAAVSIF
jgi:Na+-translocating ferredoxin:NAD+ oxidoreductase RnfD subunit